jgi:hypothetical protein
VGVAFLLLGVAALLAGVALLYRPELPRRLLVWVTKRDDLQLRLNGDGAHYTCRSHVCSHGERFAAVRRRSLRKQTRFDLGKRTRVNLDECIAEHFGSRGRRFKSQPARQVNVG